MDLRPNANFTIPFNRFNSVEVNFIITNKGKIKNIAWCIGGAQSFIEDAINLNVDLYLSGEVSEKTPAAAKENNITFISAGHHATERYGVQALCKHLCAKFKLQHQYIEVENSV